MLNAGTPSTVNLLPMNPGTKNTTGLVSAATAAAASALMLGTCSGLIGASGASAGWLNGHIERQRLLKAVKARLAAPYALSIRGSQGQPQSACCAARLQTTNPGGYGGGVGLVQGPVMDRYM